MVMEVSVPFPHGTATPITMVSTLIPSFFRIKINNRVSVNAKLHKAEDDGLFLRAAVDTTCLRYRETLRPDPLFVDPYVGCLLPPGTKIDTNESLHNHCLATKFIDDKLQDLMKKDDDLRQVVLLTDGMDTRPYRINWPRSTIIFDVSTESIFRSSIKKLEDVGAKIPRSCLFLHIPSETCNTQQVLRSKGFNGARPSVWVLQGLPILSLTHFKDILDIVCSLAMKGSIFFGELPISLAETENKSAIMRWMDKLFMSHGLRVEMIPYDQVARDFFKETTAHDHNNVLFFAEQLQFSDDQMEIWRREFQRIEEDGDEEGFEEI